MDNEPDVPLEEAARLRGEPALPRALEARVVRALRAEGLIVARAPWSQARTIAASLLIFAAGSIAGHYAWPEATATSSRSAATNRYLLLLAGDVAPAADGSSRAAEYGDWARGLAARGIGVTGEELSTHAEVVAGARPAALSDLSSVGGYFVIEAKDDAAAASLARSCPHVKYGGSVVVRRIQ